jgi:mono/diheme cytochrome c family protein
MSDAWSRRRANAVIAAICGLLAAHCGPRSTSSTAAASRSADTGVVAHVEIDPAPAALERLRARRVRVDDPVYHVTKEYEGYDIGEVIDTLFAGDVRANTNVDVVFVCSDGYRARLPIANIRDGGVLAARDTSVPLDVRWQPLRQGREYMLPTPYYLVWPPRRNPAIEYPWPYRVVALELARPEQKVQTGDPAVSRGEDLFRQYCARCHAVNLQGGTLGPELNVPLNVTEYWNAETLKKLIQDPALVRASSKMPASTQLHGADVDAIVAYLTFMKGNKIRVN